MKNLTCAWTYILCRNIIVFVPFFSLPFILFQPFSSHFVWICPTHPFVLFSYSLPSISFVWVNLPSLWFSMIRLCSCSTTLTDMYLARAQEINVNIVCVSYRVRQFFRGKIDEIINTKSINSLRYILNKVIYFSILNKLSMFLLLQGGETLKYDVLSI